MKKRKITIDECEPLLGSYTITINNARYHKDFPDIMIKLLKEFIFDGELFLEFYRIDGINLTAKREKELENEIPALFNRYGGMEIQNEYLSMARIYDACSIYGYITAILDYYLETILFNPKVDWETFRQYHLNYPKYRCEDFIHKGLAEVLFFYFDSGDLSIYCSREKYSTKEVRGIVDKLFENM